MAESHYYSPDPAAPSRPGTVTLALPDATVQLAVDRGVFAASRMDPGTLTLLREAPAWEGPGTLLDLGCGYGPIACTLARRAPTATVWALDVNPRAVELTRTNAAGLGLRNVRVAGPDDVPDGVAFDSVWSNPPIRVGKAALHELLTRWLPRLTPQGVAWLVVQRHLGADSLAAWLQAEQGCTVERHASKRGYRVLSVRRA